MCYQDNMSNIKMLVNNCTLKELDDEALISLELVPYPNISPNSTFIGAITVLSHDIRLIVMLD